MSNKIIPRNLTARAQYNVPGNPPSTRPESGVANCYPGLEYDHRNLDRRFFPGLLFEYQSSDGTDDGNARSGAHLLAIDMSDPALRTTEKSYRDVASALSDALSGGPGTPGAALGAVDSRWYLSAITQAGKTIDLERPGQAPLDGAIIWRLVRNLRPDLVSVVLRRRDDSKVDPITLNGWRRRYTDAGTGVISLSYQPGELTQSLCSPWMHDFRDCACTYWASNHPDIVYPEVLPGEPTLSSGDADDALKGNMRVDWLRDDRSWAATSAASPSDTDNERVQISYYEINTRWQDLAIVLEDREVGRVYDPRSRRADHARPYGSPVELRDQLLQLAGLEHLATLLYLYARYSIRSPEDVRRNPPPAGQWPTLVDDVEFARHQLLEVATSEMQHLRWVNLLLALLADTNKIPGWTYEPIVQPPALVIPGAGALPTQPAELRVLDDQTMRLFIDLEAPSGAIDGRYARATATLLLLDYPRHLHETASTIVREGEQHFLKFRDVQMALRPYGKTDPVYLRKLTPGDPNQTDVKAALATYQGILRALAAGYKGGLVENRHKLGAARQLMFDLDEAAESLAGKNVGIPYFSLFNKS